MSDLKVEHFKYWCYKVLPLVYDDSLSYYEVLDKVVEKLNELIDNYDVNGEVITGLQDAINEINKWRDTFTVDKADEIIREYIATMIFVDISDAGYIIYNIPSSWSEINFNTTGLDITNDELSDDDHVANYEYGRLVLSMFVNKIL